MIKYFISSVLLFAVLISSNSCNQADVAYPPRTYYDFQFKIVNPQGEPYIVTSPTESWQFRHEDVDYKNSRNLKFDKKFFPETGFIGIEVPRGESQYFFWLFSEEKQEQRFILIEYPDSSVDTLVQIVKGSHTPTVYFNGDIVNPSVFPLTIIK